MGIYIVPLKRVKSAVTGGDMIVPDVPDGTNWVGQPLPDGLRYMVKTDVPIPGFSTDSKAGSKVLTRESVMSEASKESLDSSKVLDVWAVKGVK
jgi:hypothetical protein